MATRKTPPAPAPSDAPEYSATGALLIDGQPWFADLDGVPMNRRQYLEATKDERRAEMIAALTEPDPS